MFTITFLDADGDICTLQAESLAEAKRMAIEIVESAPITDRELWSIVDELTHLEVFLTVN